MKKFKPSALSIALMLGGLQIAAVPAFAFAEEAATQEAPAQENKNDEEVEVIEVTGFRGSVSL